MKNLFITIACMWLTFCLLVVPFIVGHYESAEDGFWLRVEDHLYYFGFIGDVND